MIRLLLEPVNLLILDEPTNHLDMATKDILKQAIKDFTGTVIVVSHDREFLDGLVEKVYEFGGGQVRECLGGIYDFLEKKKLASLQELERNKPAQAAQQSAGNTKAAAGSAKTAQAAGQAAPAPSAGKLSYAEQRERDKMIKRSAKKVEEAESEITRIEAAIADVEAKIAAGEVEGDIFNRHASLNRDLETAMSLWEVASQDHDNLIASLKS
jgi:ATP-binding cassette subfamily F protein 3